LNVPSYQVTYDIAGTATPTAAPFNFGASTLFFNTGLFWNDGFQGEGGCCARAVIPLTGAAPGSVIPFAFDWTNIATGPVYLPVSAPAGAAGLSFGVQAGEAIDAGPNPGAYPGEFTVDLAPVASIATPEPQTVALLAFGLLTLVPVARRRRA
jgi:hypothetical protein